MDLLLDGLIYAANLRPNQQFEWRHYGNGDLRLKLQERADRELPSNAKAYLPGYTNQKDLYENYRRNPADVFVNLSITEGTPVTLMEAASCGIPLIATAVGGNKEIVNEKNGELLAPDPSVDDIAAGFFHLLDHPSEAVMKREESRIIWNHHYRAETNFREFALRLENAGGM
jgi:glycosyltransferase involved in cell wall biosynthesis